MFNRKKAKLPKKSSVINPSFNQILGSFFMKSDANIDTGAKQYNKYVLFFSTEITKITAVTKRNESIILKALCNLINKNLYDNSCDSTSNNVTTIKAISFGEK